MGASRAVKDFKVEITRSLAPGTYKLVKVFKGIEKVSAVRKIFGPNATKVLSAQKLQISLRAGYAYIDVKKGAIVLSRKYLKTGSDLYLCLDMIHELVHIRQLRAGKELFDKNFSYTERPTEIEAYRIAAAQAKRMGLKGKALRDYIFVEWITEKQFQKLLRKIGA